MLIRIFVNAMTIDETAEVYRNLILSIRLFIVKDKIIKIEQYWKYENMFVIETDVLLNTDLNSDKFNEFFYTISDKWQFFGAPIDEALASSNMEGCNYIFEKVEMVNIFYVESYIQPNRLK